MGIQRTVNNLHILSFVKNNFLKLCFFKLLNDLILFTTIIIIFVILKIRSKAPYKVIRMLLFSIGIFNTLVRKRVHRILLFTINCISKLYFYLDKRFKNQLIGLLFGFSFLINQGSILLIFPILLMLLKESSSTSIFFKSLKDLLLTFSIPNIFILLLYFRKSILNVYLANYIQIPLGYTGENASSFYELRVFLREISYINIFTYLFIVTMLFIYFINLLKDKNFKLNNFYNLINLNILFSLIYYFWQVITFITI